ncbi:hypothetical protein DM860_003636 [Cuscuta australis]|uniref:SnoaL-like domain-containing protein n=1 Tax=Cuscuta australis TaxID=267555 RepID=A0A328DGN0_9ASTE|nr:hypothetical protein DM860_003636 [Cuscuta australis]
MGLVSLPFPPHTKMGTKWFSFPSQEPNPYFPLFKTGSYKSFGTQTDKVSSCQTIFSAKKRLLPVACSNSHEGLQKDGKAVEAVLKLYVAIRQKNLHELSNIIGEECRCVSNFAHKLRPFHGKKQVLEFFSSLIKSLGNNIEFVVQPSLHAGMDVGVSWKLECRKTHAPLGKGFSFHMCHVYQGKVMIRNVEMFMEPLFQIEPLRLKMMSILMHAKEKMNSQIVLRDKTERKIMKILCAVLCVVAFMFFLVKTRCTTKNRKWLGR